MKTPLIIIYVVIALITSAAMDFIYKEDSLGKRPPSIVVVVAGIAWPFTIVAYSATCFIKTIR